MPSLYYQILFWIYWLITAYFCLALIRALIREPERGVKATAAMLLVPTVLRLLLIK